MRATTSARALAETAAEKLGLSARGFTRLLRVSQTIADLARAEVVARIHVAEALAYRHRSPSQPVLRAAAGRAAVSLASATR
jgi:magnesium chelatase family protein